MNEEGQIVEKLNQLVRIPPQRGLKDGHSFLMLEANTSSKGHLFYWWLFARGLQFVFTSRRWNQTIVLDRTDVVCVCKEDYAWPYCYVCQRFHWHGRHRASERHAKNMQRIQAMNDHEVRLWVNRTPKRFKLWTLASGQADP